jgi:hypothetical protein
LIGWNGGSRWTHYNNFFDGYNYKNVEAIAVDKQNNLWCGTNMGVFKFDGTNWTAYSKENTGGGLGGNWVRSIAVDTAGNVWCGCLDYDAVSGSYVGGGLSKFSDTAWTNYKPSPAQPGSDFVSAIAFRNDDVWVGTGFCGQYNGNGLYKFDGSTWTNYINDDNSFPGSCVNDLLVDKNLNLWIASSWGLTKVDFNPTSIENETNESIPSEFSLSAYPNPFNPTTTITFGLPENSIIRLKIYNLLGENVATLVNEEMNPGYHEVVWNAGEFTSGIYFYELITPEYRLMKKLLLLK